MDKPSIRFLFDFISPYSYLAWTQLQSLAERTNTTVEPIPILFAALLEKHGQKGPAEVPPKRVYMFKDVFRRAFRLGVPLIPPPTHPFNPLWALRVASIPQPWATQKKLITGLFHAVWGLGTGIESRESVAEVLNILGLDAERLLRTAGSPEIKSLLRERTDAALAEGVFGVPTMIVGSELFWGADALEPLEAFLNGQDPLQSAGAETLARWLAIKPSAVRR